MLGCAVASLLCVLMRLSTALALLTLFATDDAMMVDSVVALPSASVKLNTCPSGRRHRYKYAPSVGTASDTLNAPLSSVVASSIFRRTTSDSRYANGDINVNDTTADAMASPASSTTVPVMVRFAIIRPRLGWTPGR